MSRADDLPLVFFQEASGMDSSYAHRRLSSLADRALHGMLMAHTAAPDFLFMLVSVSLHSDKIRLCTGNKCAAESLPTAKRRIVSA
jgi:hypothetical protein